MSGLHAQFTAWLRFEMNREGANAEHKQSFRRLDFSTLALFPVSANIWLFDLINFPPW
jgi:hypothetical protein